MVCESGRPSLFARVTFLENTANNKTANTKSKNVLKTRVPFPILLQKSKNIYTKAYILMGELIFLNKLKKTSKKNTFNNGWSYLCKIYHFYLKNLYIATFWIKIKLGMPRFKRWSANNQGKKPRMPNFGYKNKPANNEGRLYLFWVTLLLFSFNLSFRITDVNN